MAKIDILRALTFGGRVAEEEGQELAKYFVETNQWRRIFSGDVDVVYGPKGSGKSALHSLLLERSSTLLERGVLVVAAENPRGTPVFKDVVDNPPASERELMGLWQLYFLSLIGDVLQKQAPDSDWVKPVLLALQETGLMKRDRTLKNLLQAVRDYVRNVVRAESLETGVKIDPATGLPSGLTGKITFREPNAAGAQVGLVSVAKLFEMADAALEKIGFTVWVLLDRLDVAFAEVKGLEENALRALFKVYLELLGTRTIRLKIFLRSDIWKRITKEGFREASHITRHETIAWDPPSLLNLVVRRALQNEPVKVYYQVSAESVLQSFERQEGFFYSMFPDQVEVGPNKPGTFEWMLSRTKDNNSNAPRELIHLLNTAVSRQIAKSDLGEPEPEGGILFSRASIKDALPDVSRVRLEQTLYAEYPSLRPYLEALAEEKTLQSVETLSKIWKIAPDEAQKVAMELVEVGFFERRGAKEAPEFWVHFLYRDALNMVQGTAE